MEQKLPSNN